MDKSSIALQNLCSCRLHMLNFMIDYADMKDTGILITAMIPTFQ